MSKKDFISGSILEFKLPFNLGYAYCKILDFRNIREFDGVLAKVYDYIVQEPIKDIAILIKKDWLFGARRMYSLPNTRGKNAWKFKGVLVSDDDLKIPDFKDSNEWAPWINDESSLKSWYVVRNIRELKGPCNYDEVKHLENTVVSSTIGIGTRTAMEFLRNNNKSVQEYFDLSDTTYMGIYNMMINVQIFDTIPKEIRGKGLC